MIESLSIANTATFGADPEALNSLSKFNYIFGTNGTGKTTISRIIANANSFPTCTVTWKGGAKLQTLVYNHDFVDRNFNQSNELKGVFTLGEQQVDTLAKIELAKGELDSLGKKLQALNLSLHGAEGKGGKKGELAALEASLKEKCWAQKQKYDAKLQGGFEGYRNSSEKFRNKVLQEWSSNKAELLALSDLERKADGIFGQTPSAESLVATVNMTALANHESNPILKKRIVGKADVDIAAMIRALGNSDWVREGRTFYDVNDGTCPFCQQATTDAFAKSLNDYFDQTFVEDSRAIDNLISSYQADSARIQQQLAAIIASPSKFVDIEALKREKELFDALINLNQQRLTGKKKEPSQVVELDSASNILAAITALLDTANTQISAHNKVVANLAAERASLTAQVWKFVLEQLRVDLELFISSKSGLEKAIAAMTAQIAATTQEVAKKAGEIRELEKQTTSIQPTIDGINSLLASFGFRGFKITKATSGNSYKLIRPDGSDAKVTLSEGEKTFVTFLYFYHLLKGSDTETGMTTDRVVVFDDPVSSLDSDILFIVGSLIKGLIEEVRTGVGHIKQVFILTHNVYFHKEVTFNPNRRTEAMHTEETFWVVRKPGPVSKIQRHSSNPVKTSYDLLWSEVRRPDRSSLTIQNTLRRILENYFKILGGVDPDKLCAMFEGRERLVCKSLFSWVNDGSHFAHDDLYVSVDDAVIEVYLRVFRQIFSKSDHFAHYKMMMADAFVEEPAR
jgi:wobble nucleotide-excising tRNase